MQVAVKMRASRKRGRPRYVRGDRAIRLFETKMLERADAILGPSTRPRSFEKIYEMLAPLRTPEARDLRKTIANYFSMQ